MTKVAQILFNFPVVVAAVRLIGPGVLPVTCRLRIPLTGGCI